MKKIILFFLIIICVFGGIGYGTYLLTKDNKKSVTIEKKATNTIDGYNYTLDNLDTEIYKKEFNILKENLTSDNVDLEEYAKSVAKLFIIDLYTINNKINKYDVGGLEFIMKDNQSNFSTNVDDTIYKYVEDNTNGDRDQELPEVKNVTITKTEKTKYTVKGNEDNNTKDKTYDAYKINLTIDYVIDYGYDTNAEVIVINDNGIMYVVEKN